MGCRPQPNSQDPARWHRICTSMLPNVKSRIPPVPLAPRRPHQTPLGRVREISALPSIPPQLRNELINSPPLRGALTSPTDDITGAPGRVKCERSFAFRAMFRRSLVVALAVLTLLNPAGGAKSRPLVGF